MVLRLVRNASWVLIALLIVGFGVFAALREAPPTTAPRTETVELKPVAGIGGPFSLIDQNGGTFTEASLQGRPTLLFFGYTFCPDVCPTTLLEAETWMKELGADADRLRVVFVSVDPERDTPDVLAGYVSNFDPRIIGLTGPADEVAQAAADFRATYRRVDKEGGDYRMDHTAGVFLFHPDGRFASIIDFHEDRRFAVPKLRRTLS